MFGKILGEIVAAPIRVTNAAIKTAEVAFDTVFDGEPQKKGRNALDDAADAVSDTIKDTLDG